MRQAFVEKLLEKPSEERVVGKNHSFLCVCAGEAERDVFSGLGFTKVTISNLDERMESERFAPFNWSSEDAQNLSFEDASFDVVFVADGLHHCSSPHRALTEMYRVARESANFQEAAQCTGHGGDQARRAMAVARSRRGTNRLRQGVRAQTFPSRRQRSMITIHGVAVNRYG